MRFEPCVPVWELKSGFNAEDVLHRKKGDTFWVNYLGEETTQPPSEVPTVDDVVNEGTFALEDLQFRDPNRFVAGNLMS